MSSRKGPAILLLLACLGFSFIPPAGAAFKVGVEGASATKMHLRVGQSYRIDARNAIRSVSVSDPAIVEVSVSGSAELVVTGNAPGSATVTYWTEANVPASLDVDVWMGSNTPEERTALLSMDKPEKSASLGAGTVGASTGAAIVPNPTEGVSKPADVGQATGLPEAAGIGRNVSPGDGSGTVAEHKDPFLVAVLPVENLSGKPGPLKEIRQSLAEGLKRKGIAVLPERELEGFMARNRMRYTGGINRELAQAFLRETGTKGVLITSLEYLSEGPPPKISLLLRLVSTGELPVILWMKSLGMSGDDHPGILGLGLIWTPEEILRRAVGTALDSLALSVPAGMDRVAVLAVHGGKFRPKRFFRFPELAFGGDRPVTVAVVPFMNIGTRKNAGSLMELHFVDRLAQAGNVRVIEPGVIREEMLRLRIIMQGGLSDPQAGLLFSMLDTDLLLSGLVAEYQDYEGGTGGQAKIAFSVQAFDKKSRRVVWSSRSYNRGDDGVFFFDVGEVKTAAAMASEMAWAVVERMIFEKR